MKILSIFNICGAGRAENVPHYNDSIRSLLNQQHLSEGSRVAVSGCMTTDSTKFSLVSLLGDSVSYNWTEELYPLSITFNDTVDQMVKRYGEFDGYLYVDSGISFWDPSCRYDALKIMCDVHKSGPYAITSAFPSNDDGKEWWGIQYTPGQDFVFPLGKTTNMHCQIFDEEWRKAYGHILPDIFADHTMESVFSYMTAAIKRKFVMTQKVCLQHQHSMDGASINSRDKRNHPDYIPSSEYSPDVRLYKTKKNMDQKWRHGYKYGFGYEGCKPYWPHWEGKYDLEEYATDPELKEFIRQELFLKPEEFSYDSVKRMFVPGK